MSAIKTRDIERALTSKGFQKELTHHEMFWFFHKGKRTSIRTRISHSLKEYSDPLLTQMAKQMKLTREELDDFVDCNLSGEGYLKTVNNKGFISCPHENN